jgi:hypothetical protein
MSRKYISHCNQYKKEKLSPADVYPPGYHTYDEPIVVSKESGSQTSRSSKVLSRLVL